MIELENEEWKPVFGFEDYYEISNYGRVKRLEIWVQYKYNIRFKPEILISPCQDKDGYYRTAFWKNKKAKSLRINRVVAMAFIPNPENKPQVNHINGIKFDDRVENLEWATASENCLHSVRILGNIPPLNTGKCDGEKGGMSKLTNNDIIEIRKIYGTTSQKEIAKKFNVSTHAIYCIMKRKTWKHI